MSSPAFSILLTFDETAYLVYTSLSPNFSENTLKISLIFKVSKPRMAAYDRIP